MKFMLLQDYAPTEVATEFIGAWAPEDAAAHIEFQRRMNDRLTESGELVEAQALTGPELANSSSMTALGRRSSPMAPSRRARSSSPATGSSTLNHRNGRSISRPRRRLRPGRAASRSRRRSRCAS